MEVKEFILPKGQRERFQIPFQTGSLKLKKCIGLRIYYVKNYSWTLFPVGQELSMPLEYEGLMSIVPDDSYGNFEAILEYINTNGDVQKEILINVISPNIELNIDSNRDGNLNRIDIGDENWVWGKYQMGAIVLVNNDKDIPDLPNESNVDSEFGMLELKPSHINYLGQNKALVLSTSENASKRFRVYAKNSASNKYEVILGKVNDDNFLEISRPLNFEGERLYIEALEFPNAYFEGLITIEVGIYGNGIFKAYDKVVFRVAPWIMTPNTLPAIEVFACKIESENEGVNNHFLEVLKNVLDDINVPLKIIPPVLHGNDRWIQDEIEFGYCQGPTSFLPVVFDSPRDRGLDNFPEASLLGPDFGHFQIGGSTPNSLDSFGNLEVCPPTTVNGKHYPFGRIIFGGRKYGDYSANSRQMMTEIRRFLYSQKIQSPIEIFTDWLAVGHVDEIICFVPSENNVGFKLLIASPMRAKAILDRLNFEGQGDKLLFEGKMRESAGSGIYAEISISDLLADTGFWNANFRYQEYLNYNQQILEEKLGISDNEIVQIPVLFQPVPDGERTAAYFPDMVNHLVIGENSIVPKPFGPLINGKCAFEKSFEEALPERNIYFVDDWYSYHEMLGEVHCGTNTRREPFKSKKWWEFMPDGGYNI